jgi:hypothetical protein
MLKFFSDLPAEFEQYNPVNACAYFDERETRDENGLLHSYDDKPSRVKINGERTWEFLWHSHGKLHRENNQPPYLFFAKDVYVTLNADEKEHSFNGNPSKILYQLMSNSFTAVWAKNGATHRENDLPAILSINNDNNELIQEDYYKNGHCHRSGNRRATYNCNRESWEVKGIIHNDESYAELSKIMPPYLKKWVLYGVPMKEHIFDSIKTFQREKNVPLWVAFFNSLELIEESEIDLLLDTVNNFDEVPFQWVIRSLGITDEIFNKQIGDLFGRTKFIQETFSLKAVETIVKFDKENEATHA